MEWIILLFCVAIIITIVYVFRLISERRYEERLKLQGEEYERRAQERTEAIMKEAKAVQARQELKNQGIPVISNDHVEKYMNREITLKTAERFADYFILKIKSLDRNVRITTIEHSLEFGATIGDGEVCTKVAPLITKTDLRGTIFEHSDYLFNFISREHCFIDFVSENLCPLQNQQEMNSFVRAVAIKALEIIKQKYPVDKSGTEYQIVMREYSGRGYNCNGIAIKYEYSARNGNYTAPKEW